MTSKDIKQGVVFGAIWKFAERILAQGVSFVISIIIARILEPEAYGVVGLVTIFFNFSNVIILGGLNIALIQKKDADDKDYSSVLIVSFVASLAIYGILFVCAPLMAQLYNQPILTSLLRVMGLILPINAVQSVWSAHISARMRFRKFFFSTIGGTIVSGIVGVAMAYGGSGAWALVAQQMVNAAVGTAVLVFTERITLCPKISLDRIRGLLRYGWKVFVSSIINTAYAELNPMIIGLRFNSVDLSYYTKGKSFPGLISTTISSTLSAVLFPALAKNQNDKTVLLHYTRLFIRQSSFVLFPLMLGLFAIADNFIMAIMTEKWLEAVPYVRIFCIAGMFDVIHTGNCETIKAMGRSDVFLIMEIIKKTLYFVVIGVFVFLSDSAKTLAYSMILCALIATVVNSIPNRKLIGYSFFAQIQDLLPNLLSAAVMCGVVYWIGEIISGVWVALIAQIAIGVVVYVLLNAIFRNPSLPYSLELIKKVFKKRRNGDA